jgi:tetratricopeptide (TPR) repeat protein
MAGGPTLRGFCSYTAGEIENACGVWDLAEQHYAGAIALARQSGATFLSGIASVGLVTALAAAGRVDDALRGYRDVIDYWAAAGNWTHLWVTLRNLAELLRRLGDDGPATLIDAAADRAPDAPAVGSDPRPAPPRRPPPAAGRGHVLDVARRTIERHLNRS